MESAVAYLRRALEEPPPDAERAEVLLELGSAEAHVSGVAAVEHLREAQALTTTRCGSAEIARLLGGQLFVLRGEESDAVLRTRSTSSTGPILSSSACSRPG